MAGDDLPEDSQDDVPYAGDRQTAEDVRNKTAGAFAEFLAVQTELGNLTYELIAQHLTPEERAILDGYKERMAEATMGLKDSLWHLEDYTLNKAQELEAGVTALQAQADRYAKLGLRLEAKIKNLGIDLDEDLKD